jgi:hypothetical protein
MPSDKRKQKGTAQAQHTKCFTKVLKLVTEFHSKEDTALDALDERLEKYRSANEAFCKDTKEEAERKEAQEVFEHREKKHNVYKETMTECLKHVESCIASKYILYNWRPNPQTTIYRSIGRTAVCYPCPKHNICMSLRYLK